MPKGGKRPGAGRPKGSGKFGEPTLPRRIPGSLADRFDPWVRNAGFRMRHFDCRVPAGSPGWVSGEPSGEVELNDLLKVRGRATFVVTVRGDSMEGAGIHEDDHLVVDPGREAASGDIVIALVDGEVTVKRLRDSGGVLSLCPENDRYGPIPVDGKSDVTIQGVVMAVIHPL